MSQVGVVSFLPGQSCSGDPVKGTTVGISQRTQAAIAAFGARGTFRRVTYKSRVATAAAHRHREVVKVSTFTCRAGVDYAHLAVNAGRETGPLNYGEWAEGYEGLVLLHKGTEQVRVTFAPNAHPRSVFTIDGQEATREEVAALLTPAAASKFLTPRAERPEDDPVVMNLKVEGILAVGDVTLTA
jgi:hypothetical protein